MVASSGDSPRVIFSYSAGEDVRRKLFTAIKGQRQDRPLLDLDDWQIYENRSLLVQAPYSLSDIEYRC